MPDTAALLDAVRASAASPESAGILARHLDSDQVAALRARTEALGPVAHYLLEVEWPELYRRAERHRVAGIPPDDPRVQLRRPTAGGTSAGTWTWPDSGGTTRRNMPDKPPAPRIPVAVASAVVLLLCTLLYVVVAALGDAPWGVVPALLVASAVYGVAAWYRQRRVGRQH